MLTLKRSFPATEMSKAELLKSASIKHRVAHLRSIYTHSHELLDKSIVIFYPSESSYNGEDIVELQVHGSRAIIKNIFEELKRLGFRMAERG
jgi:tRNA modification GTPase